jgi:hypothetical protein
MRWMDSFRSLALSHHVDTFQTASTCEKQNNIERKPGCCASLPKFQQDKTNATARQNYVAHRSHEWPRRVGTRAARAECGGWQSAPRCFQGREP